MPQSEDSVWGGGGGPRLLRQSQHLSDSLKLWSQTSLAWVIARLHDGDCGHSPEPDLWLPESLLITWRWWGPFTLGLNVLICKMGRNLDLHFPGADTWDSTTSMELVFEEGGVGGC